VIRRGVDVMPRGVDVMPVARRRSTPDARLS